MQLIRFTDAETYEPEPHWKRASLCCEDDISIEHFVKPPGHRSPRHRHPNAQVLVVLEGSLAIVDCDEVEHVLGVGDTAYIPGGEMHVVINPGEKPSVGLDIFVPGRSFDFWLKRKKG